jgi:hypothetical protein
MIEFRRIVDDIERQLNGHPSSNAEVLKSLATEYRLACDAANSRLQACVNLLKQGLTDEAIRQCCVEPSVFTVTHTLNFAKRRQWIDVLKRHSIEPPPKLMTEANRELLEVHQEYRLAPLLSKHRLLALAHAPLSLRIPVLRELVKHTRNNAFWKKDLAEYEQARLTEIAAEAKWAHQHVDRDALTALRNELQHEDWQVPPSRDVVHRVDNYYREVQAKTARWELEELEKELNAAWAEFDASAARVIREKWNERATIVGLKGDDELAQQAAAALEWLAEEDRRIQATQEAQAAIAALERALDENEPRAELERLFQRIQRADGEIPETLKQQYVERIALLVRAERARIRRRFALITIVVLAVGGLSTWGFTFYSQQRAVNDRAEQFRSLIEAEQLDAAQLFYAELKVAAPDIASHQSLQQLHVTLLKRQAEETDRRDTLRQLLDAAKANPNQIDRSSLAKARDLAKTEAELTEVESIEALDAAARQASQQQRDDTFVQKVNDLRNRVSALEQDRTLEAAAKTQAIRQLDLELQQVDSSSVNVDLLPQLEQVRGRLDAVRQTHDNYVRMLNSKQELVTAVGSHTRYVAALRLFAQSFPQTKTAADFQTALQEQDLWKGMDAWSALAAAWRNIDLGNLNSVAAAAQVQQIKDNLAAYPGLPQAEAFKTRLPYLEAIARRSDAVQGPLTRSLELDFKDPLVVGLWVVEDDAGKQYYISNSINLGQQTVVSVNLSYLVAFDQTRKQRSLLKSAIKFHDRAPQSVAAASVLDRLSKMESPRDWERTFYFMLFDITSQQRMDPVLKVTLLQKTIRVACEGSHAMRLGFGKYHDLLQAPDFALNANWMDPDDEDAKRAKTLANLLLQRLPDLLESATRTAEYVQQARAPAGTAYRWFGWLGLDSNGTWHCNHNSGLSASGRLYVVQGVGEGFISLNLIGSISGGQIQLNPQSSTVLVEGRPVFLEDTISPP